METVVTYRQLEMKSLFTAGDREAFEALLQQLFHGARAVYQYFHTDHPQLKQSLLVEHALRESHSVSRLSIFLDPHQELESSWMQSIAGDQSHRILQYPGKSMIRNYSNPWAILLFSDAQNDWVGVLEMPTEGHFKVMWSWGDPKGQVTKLKKLLEELLVGEAPQKPTYTASVEGGSKPPDNPTTVEEHGAETGQGLPKSIPGFSEPEWLDLHDYQEQAINAWRQNKGRGIFAMATGSGKTLTALALATRVARKNRPLVVVVVCPFINLCNQWMEEIAAFHLRSVPCFEGRHRWEALLIEAYQSISVGLESAIAIITTTRTFQSPAFQSQLRMRVETQHHLLIADEVHNLGAAKIQKYLPEEIRLRVGLSATPERHMDPEGTQALFDYFGDIVYEYPIARAIAEGRLCSYYYYPHIVQLTENETIEYQEITEKLGRLIGSDEDSELGQAALSLLIRRSRLLAGAENKLDVLDQVLRDLPEKPRQALFYCGDGRTTDKIAAEEVRQIEAVARLLGQSHGLRVRNFTYREKSKEREKILRDLASGFLDGVVAIRCLDEGIDLPDLRIGFLLASSTNPRQFIQRRGRLLRHAANKDFAIIHDFIIEPPDFGGSLSDDAYNLERRFFKRELSRILDFCNTAENGQAALNALKAMRLKYNSIS